MSDAIEEISGEKKGRESAMAAWAASIAARNQNQQNQGPEQEVSGGGGASRTNASQRPKKIKTVTKVQDTQTSVKNDSVDLGRNAEKSEAELTMKDAQAMMRGKRTQTTAPPTKAPAPPPTQNTKVQVEKAIKETAKEEVAKEAEVVTAEEVQSSPSIASTVAAKSSRKTQKAKKTEEKTESKAVEESEDDVDLAELIKPGNDTKASAYLRAGDLMGDDSNPDLNDFIVAL